LVALKSLGFSAALALHCNKRSASIRAQRWQMPWNFSPGRDHRHNHMDEESSIMRNGIFHLVTATALTIALSASSATAQK